MGAEPLPQKVAELSFDEPKPWKRAEIKPAAGLGLLYAVDGPGKIYLTVERIAASEALALTSESLAHPLSAPETAKTLARIQRNGIEPKRASAEVTDEQGATVTALVFEGPQAWDGKDHGMVVMITEWKSGATALRASFTLQAALSAASKEGVRKVRQSLLYRGKPTLGFSLAKLPGEKHGAAEESGPAPSPEPAAREFTVSGAAADLVKMHRASLVTMEGGNGAGSGFLGRMPDGIFVLTDQHVAGALPAMRAVSLDKRALELGAGEVATGYDVIRFAVKGDAVALPVTMDIDADAEVGDDIAVLVSDEKTHVATPLSGKVIGIGPDRIEVTAEFAALNSGSPIIHLKSGKVIGIATYFVEQRYPAGASTPKEFVRRFGWRLDNVHAWRAVAWPAFRGDAVVLEGVVNQSKELTRLIGDWSKHVIQASNYSTTSLYRIIHEYETAMGKKGLSASDRDRVENNFLSSLRAASVADLSGKREAMHYDYFQRQLAGQIEFRGEMAKVFDGMLRGKAR